MDNFSQTDKEDYHFKFKVLVCGDVHCGKTTFLDSLSQENGKMIDLEASEEISERTCLHMNNHFLFKATYWECPGKDRIIKFISNYALGSNIVIVMFDFTKRSSLDKAERILKELEICDIPIKILVGNKIDLVGTKKNLSDIVPQVEADKLARAYKIDFFPCNSTFKDAIKTIYDHQMKSINDIIGKNIDLERFIQKNIMVGKRVFTHPTFLKSLKEGSYFEKNK